MAEVERVKSFDEMVELFFRIVKQGIDFNEIINDPSNENLRIIHTVF